MSGVRKMSESRAQEAGQGAGCSLSNCTNQQGRVTGAGCITHQAFSFSAKGTVAHNFILPAGTGSPFWSRG